MDEFEKAFDTAFEDTIPEDDEAEETAGTETEGTETEGTVQGDAQTEGTGDQDGQEPAAAATIDYKYNHETKALDRAAVETIAASLGLSAEDVIGKLQKGSDYDRIRGRHDEMTTVISGIAKAYNTTPDKVGELVAQIADQAAYRKAYADARAADPNAGEETLKRIAEQQMKLDRESERRAEAQQQDESLKPWVDFFTKHTDLSPDTIPDEVKDMADSGTDPEIAYLLYTQNQTILQLQKENNDMKTKAKSPGSVTGSGNADKKSAFDEGWDEAFS